MPTLNTFYLSKQGDETSSDNPHPQSSQKDLMSDSSTSQDSTSSLVVHDMMTVTPSID